MPPGKHPGGTSVLTEIWPSCPIYAILNTERGLRSWESPDGGYFSSSETSSAIEATSQTFWELTLAVPDSMTVERSDSYALAYEDDARDRWFVLFAKLPSGPAALQTLEGYAAALLQGEAVEEVDLTAAEDTPPASSGVATHSVSSRFTSDGTYGQMTVNTFQDSNWVYAIVLVSAPSVEPPENIFDAICLTARVDRD